MRKKNCIAEFEAHRRKFLIENFRRALAEQSRITAEKTFRMVADTPAPRFWVSERRAAAVIGKMLAGIDPTPGMHPEKKEMYLEIYRRIIQLRKIYPESSISSLIFDVVNAPAPRSYITWHRVRSIIYKRPHPNDNRFNYE